MTMENCNVESTIHDVTKVVIGPEKLSRLSPTEIYSSKDLLIYKKDGTIIGFNLFSDGINPIEVI